MAAPMENVELEICEIEATVATGFENVAQEEAKEKLGVIPTVSRGKIVFSINENDAIKVIIPISPIYSDDSEYHDEPGHLGLFRIRPSTNVSTTNCIGVLMLDCWDILGISVTHQ